MRPLAPRRHPDARSWPGPLLVGALTTVVCLLQILLGRDAGFADNGDGRRLMCQLDLAPVEGVFWDSAVFGYGPIGTPPGECGGEELRYPTAWAVLLRPVVGIERLLTGSDAFDLRVLGVLGAILLGVGVGLLAAALRARTPARLAVVALMGLMVSDLVFTGYLAAPYPEAGGFVGLLLLLAALTRWASGRRGLVDLGLLTLAAVAVGTVKAQLSPLMLVVALLLVVHAFWPSRGGQARTRSAARRGADVGAALVLVLGCSVFLGLAGSEYDRINTYNLLFKTILADSKTPEQDLAELGLPPSLAEYAGTSAFEPGNAVASPDYPQARDDFGRGDAVRFLLRHPERAVAMVDLALSEASQPRLTYLSNVEQDPASPPQVKQGLDVASTMLSMATRTSAWLLALLWCGSLAAGAVLHLRRGATREQRAWSALVAGLAVIAASQLVVSLLGDGYYELRKHLVFSSWATALLPVALCGLVLVALARHAPARTTDREHS